MIDIGSSRKEDNFRLGDPPSQTREVAAEEEFRFWGKKDVGWPRGLHKCQKMEISTDEDRHEESVAQEAGRAEGCPGHCQLK